MAAHDNLGPQFMYHATHVRNRESISQTGLRTDFSADADFDQPGSAGIYLSAKPGGATGPHQDVWKADVSGLDMQPDAPEDSYGPHTPAGSAYVSDTNIGPERLSLHHRAEK